MTRQSEEGARNEDGIILSPDQAKSRRARNIAIGVACALFVVLFYVVTIVKLGGSVLQQSGMDHP